MEQQKIIITINRECGSGGGSIARMLGEKLGLKVYDRTLLESLAEQYGMTVEKLDRIKAQNPHWWDDICRFYQQFGAFRTRKMTPDLTPMSLYYAEARLMREVAEKESCIIIGRAGFHTFSDYPEALHIFIIADRDARISRIAQKENLGIEEAAKIVDRIDKDRDTFIKNVADVSRYDARNYNLVLKVSGIPSESVASFLADNIRLRLQHAPNTVL